MSGRNFHHKCIFDGTTTSGHIISSWLIHTYSTHAVTFRLIFRDIASSSMSHSVRQQNNTQTGEIHKNDMMRGSKHQQFKWKHAHTFGFDVLNKKPAAHSHCWKWMPLKKRLTPSKGRNVNRSVDDVTLVSDSCVTSDEFNGIKRSQRKPIFSTNVDRESERLTHDDDDTI